MLKQSGGPDPEDESLKDAVARELKEETGLTSAWMVQEVGHGARFQMPVKGVVKEMHVVTFIVEADEIGKLEYAEGGKALKNFDGQHHGQDNHDAKPAFVEEMEQVSVKLNPEEHSKYLWVTEDVIQSQDVKGEKLTFVSSDARIAMLQAFGLQKFIIQAKAVV